MTKYVIENGLRKVKPYYLTYKTPVKLRWCGRTLTKIFQTDFGEREEDIVSDIKNNHLYILSNVGRAGGPTEIKGWDLLQSRQVDGKDVIYHQKHKHEPSVPWVHESIGIAIIYQDSDLVVVNKPAGIPTHATGSYMYNSVVEILKEQLGTDSIWPCHRLDKVTSGVLILAKSKEATCKMSKLIQEKKTSTEKKYLARVKGKFPEGEYVFNCPVFSVNVNGGYLQPPNSHQLQANSTTIFTRLSYNDDLDQSIVLCKPITGKFHQIRIHLRNLGYPIANDFLYNPESESSNEIIKAKNQLELELYQQLFRKYPKFEQLHQLDKYSRTDDEIVDLLEAINWDNDNTIKEALQILKNRQAKKVDEDKNSEQRCTTCNRKLFNVDKAVNPIIWLHALSYSLADDKNSYKFETEYPQWSHL
ncbi:DRAP deaminase and pseudouridylate synthase [Spathaspora passalidarum NRRL Y-27907]|uniref:DRAP deaminase and pseudouridylate synthase n=1 Tax=Spathaspora passalidarum (strain NRRL Y-27907 / 11-Y1) TaxID=619300 RepID=G3AG74_SPAPN|nr:DRAP deaminase and pseudouridylate synthase [Spathaspora passalidarum NRRL Y-27907]EGW35213.1 DRAP deaminase and pseudouridylate synthase [Spathaspora passalidarum NRRL Y-27907]